MLDKSEGHSIGCYLHIVSSVHLDIDCCAWDCERSISRTVLNIIGPDANGIRHKNAWAMPIHLRFSYGWRQNDNVSPIHIQSEGIEPTKIWLSLIRTLVHLSVETAIAALGSSCMERENTTLFSPAFNLLIYPQHV